MIHSTGKAEKAQEKVKELIELAISCGRHLQSPQTGYVHHYYHSQENDPQHTIPIMENVLFILALLRSRTMENINEAKDLLNRLLVFQSQLKEFKGNFPVYLHEYPHCRDPLLGVHLLPPFYWILKGFGHVLGQDLKKKLESGIKDVLAYSFRIHEKEHLPYSIAVKLAAAAEAYGKLGSQTELEQQGQKMLNDFLIIHKVDSWHITGHLADLLVALQMVYPSLINSPWHELWKYLSQTWQSPCCSYVGPCLKEEQKGQEPESTLYDLFLNYFAGKNAYRINQFGFYQLQAALIQPSEDRLIEQPIPFQVRGEHQFKHWMLWQEKEWAYTLIEKKEHLNSVRERTYTPFRLVWGDIKRTHTLVFQGGNCSTVQYQANKNHIQLLLKLKEQNDLEEGDKQREISFYLDFHPDTQMRIDGQTATTFHLGQKVTIQSGARLFSLAFELVEGEGQFLGHLMRGNRPSQIDLKGENRFNAYDWHILLRTIRRKGPCLLKAVIQIEA